MIALTEQDRQVSILGVHIDDVTVSRGIDIVEEMIQNPKINPYSIFFVNAHTLNLAHADKDFTETLNQGDRVFGDGTGVRWGAKLQGIQVRDNLVGTDFIPSLFTETADKGYSYYLLGSDEETVQKAAEYASKHFPGWKQAGYHHGFIKGDEARQQAIDDINARKPDIVLVGMGNPLQERWIEQYKDQLNTHACLGIGGLYDYWAENVSRAPQWVRKAGYEWAWRLFQQPRDKAKRYLIGNPLYLMNIFREHLHRKKEDSSTEQKTKQLS